MVNLLFDYDGTLHDCVKIYAPSFRLACKYLNSLGILGDRYYSDEEISRWLGYSSKDMWNNFMPNLCDELKEKCSKIIGDEMQRLVNSGKARLYPYITDILSQLKNDGGYRLIFLSNCKRDYMQTHINFFSLDYYFSSFYCAEDFSFMPKYRIFDYIKEKHIGDWIVIGDRFHDMEIASKYNLPSIGCAYGYGLAEELKSASCIAQKPGEIYDKIKSIILK